MRGKFITFEGPEGSGKSTHSKLLCKWLRQKGIDVLHTREPGGTRLGERLREILLHAKDDISALGEMFLYQAARTKIIDDVIEPALKKGKVVVCDRFLDATVAYQGYGGGVDLGLIERLGKLSTYGITPDLTILLDIDTRTGLRRSKEDGADRIERKSIAYHKKVRQGYAALARRYPRRIKLIKVDDDKGKIQAKIRLVVAKWFGLNI